MKPKPFSFENHLTVPSANVPPSYTNDGPGTEPPCFAPTARTIALPPRYGKEPAPVAGGANRVSEERCDRHRADAPRDGRDEACNLGRRGVYVAPEPVVRPVHADVDDCRARVHVT